MNNNLINCYNIETKRRERFPVNDSVYTYIRQLESKLRYYDESKLFDVYPELKPKKEEE